MKKLLFISILAIGLASCASTQSAIIPKAINTVNTTGFAELNLDRADYEILNTLTAEAVVNYNENRNGTEYTIAEATGEFSLRYAMGKKLGWSCYHMGILKLGYLSNDYAYNPDELNNAEMLARRLATYRLINLAKEHGADGIIEPTITTNVEQIGQTIAYKSVVSAKIVRLKTNN